MTKIFFAPEYAGIVYINPMMGDVMIDSMVVNTFGLVNLLELQLGLHFQEVPTEQRLAIYYNAMEKYMKKEPENILASSFKTSPLSTAKVVLSWRDELKMVQWNFQGEDISERLKAIISIEQFFEQEDTIDLPDRIQIVIEQLNLQKLNCNEMEIEIPCDITLLKPIVKKLLSAIENQGAKIVISQVAMDNKNNLSAIRNSLQSNENKSITINKNDISFQIYKFKDEHAANEYFSYTNSKEKEVWINADNKALDNWMSLMNKPLSGSTANNCSPQLTQLFIIGIARFENPLNIRTLIEWLYMPLHPLDAYFRNILAKTIINEGGYRNEKCRKVINDYIDGKYVYLTEEEKLLPEEKIKQIQEADKKKRIERVETYLPSLESSETINTADVKNFCSALSSWTRQKAHLLAERNEKKMWSEQLQYVATMADSFLILLNTISTQEIEYKTIDSWLNSIYQPASFTYSIPEKDCQMVLDSPAKMVHISDYTIWMGIDGDSGKSLECSFLHPSEKRLLTERNLTQFWEEECEMKYYGNLALMPFFKTQKQLILVVCERRNNEYTQKHPLIVRLEQILDENQLNNITLYPQFSTKLMSRILPIEKVENNTEIHFKHADKLKWPNHLSPTVMGTLILHPFDFLMENLLNITSDEKGQISEIKRISGNVAHAVIERLFSPRDGKKYASPQEIEIRIDKEYREVYHEIIEANGAILHLAENKLSEKQLFKQLKENINKLLNILKENDLKVTGCEEMMKNNMNLGLPPKQDNTDGELADMYGFIDMTLEDKSGRPIVIDFKWTSSKSYYPNLLVENRSIQLEMYRYLLSQQTKDCVERVAYYLMPEGKLYSKEAFKGNFCEQILPNNDNNIVEQLCNSIHYRKQQIDHGIIERNSANIDYIQYAQDCEKENLFPLLEDTETPGTKEANRFSNYKLF